MSIPFVHKMFTNFPVWDVQNEFLGNYIRHYTHFDATKEPLHLAFNSCSGDRVSLHVAVLLKEGRVYPSVPSTWKTRVQGHELFEHGTYSTVHKLNESHGKLHCGGSSTTSEVSFGLLPPSNQPAVSRG